MTEPKELGTLIVVVGKARNLPNKSRFGKQDPFCSVQVGKEKQKTKAIKRGGQHPEWDEELRFTIMEDVEDMLAASAAAQNSLKGKKDDLPPLPSEPGVVTPATLASNARKSAANTPKKKKVSKSMTISCYADDPKEPELIGEVVVVLDEALKKGEVDEWYEFSYKDKYSGEVYLELTYYSNEAPPVQRNVPRPNVYGGANNTAPSRPGIPTSVSVTGMNLYIPPYQQPGRVPSPGIPHGAPQGQVAHQPQRIAASNSFAELGLPPRASSMAVPAPQQQQDFQPRPGMKHSSTTTDMLSGQMMSMSLGPGSSRPNTGGQYNAQTLNHSGSHHRHSFAANSQPQGAAPWAPLLPQNQSQQPGGSATPLPRPTSSMDIPGQWNGAQSAPPRPVSSYGTQQQQQPQHHRTGSINLDVPAPYTGGLSQSPSHGNLPRPPKTTTPEGYRVASPQLPQQYPPHRMPSPQPPSQQFPQPHRVPSPQPPQQLPPQGYVGSPQRNDSYGSQYGGQQQANPYQSPGQPAYSQPPPLPHTPQQQGSGYNSYNSTPGYPGGHQRNNSIPAPQRHDSHGNAYSSPGQGPPPPPPPTQSPPSTSTGAYVPWFMQTQPVTHSPNQQHTNLPQPPPQQGGYYSQPNEPPQPPNPPPPPRHGVGYYPSDELYAGQQNTSSTNPYGAPPAQPQFNQAPPPPQPPANPGWNSSTQHYQQPQQSSTLSYAQQDQPPGWSNPARAPSPLGRPPDPLPPGSGRTSNTDWRSYLSGLGGSGAPPAPAPPGQQLNAPPPVPQRVASPGKYGSQAEWYTPPPNLPSSISNGSGQWQGGQAQAQDQGQNQWQSQQRQW